MLIADEGEEFTDDSAVEVACLRRDRLVDEGGGARVEGSKLALGVDFNKAFRRHSERGLLRIEFDNSKICIYNLFRFTNQKFNTGNNYFQYYHSESVKRAKYLGRKALFFDTS